MSHFVISLRFWNTSTLEHPPSERSQHTSSPDFWPLTHYNPSMVQSRTVSNCKSGDAIKYTEFLGTNRRTRMIGLLRERVSRRRIWMAGWIKRVRKGERQVERQATSRHRGLHPRYTYGEGVRIYVSLYTDIHTDMRVMRTRSANAR